MIQQVNLSSVNSNSGVNRNKKQPQFKGGPIDVAVAALQACEANPMLNVAVADLATAIIPRTVIESQTNPYAGLEALRRESSGLIINCLIPGFIVAGIAKAIQGPIMGNGSNMSDCWANRDTVDLVTKYWAKAEGANDEEKIANTFRNILNDTKGRDGAKEIDFSSSKFDFSESIKELTEETLHPKSKEAVKSAKEAAKKANVKYETPVSKIIKQTNAAENIKIGESKEYFSQGLGDILNNATKILREMTSPKNVGKAAKDVADDFASKAKTLVTAKSLGGLAVIIPLALLAQPINRWITEKTSGKKGAPIYKDFEKSKDVELSSKEKFELNKQKLVSATTMVAVAAASIMKKPSAMFNSLTQFKGIFPSQDQARLISTATFVSRMMSSEDKNDLREATVRDIATFSSFYFLGDYIAKGIASGIENTIGKDKGFKLINDLKPGKDSNIFKAIWHWTKNTALKSSEEIYGATPEITKYAQKMRGICQLGNIAFSLLSLGLLIPIWNRHQTDKKREEELKNKSVNVTINKQSA